MSALLTPGQQLVVCVGKPFPLPLAPLPSRLPWRLGSTHEIEIGVWKEMKLAGLNRVQP